ncbi:MAG: nucleolar RNA-binding Nop10p family protein [Candidatus Kariarchaeaceae archaeon]
MKSLYRCAECGEYSLHGKNCKICEGPMKHPYPARFSIVKEQKYRYLIRRTQDE